MAGQGRDRAPHMDGSPTKMLLSVRIPTWLNANHKGTLILMSRYTHTLAIPPRLPRDFPVTASSGSEALNS